MGRNGRRIASWSVLAAALLVTALVLAAVPVGAAGGVRYVDKYLTRNCQGKTPCYHTIQAAVNHAQPGDTIYVFPATYEGGVDLKQMNPEGDITLVTVDASGNPTPGTVTIDNDDAPEIYGGSSLDRFNGDVTIDGFVLRSPYGAIDLCVGSAMVASGGEGGLGPFLSRDVEIRNVDASHTGGDGITVRAQGDVTIKDCTTNDNQGYGIGVTEAWGDVTITGCTSNQNKGPATTLGGYIGCLAGGICVMGAEGQVTIRNNTANGNAGEGILVDLSYIDGQEAGLASATTPDQVIIDKCTADHNDGRGIEIHGVGGDVSITDCTTNGNSEDGVLVRGLLYGDGTGAILRVDGGDVTIQNCTAKGNDEVGFDPTGILGTVSIQACVAQDNYIGVDLDGMSEAESVLVNGSVICGNECGLRYAVPQLNAEGNWWGCDGGPEAAGCDPICQEDGIAVDFTPWIAKISDSATVDPAMVGQPTVVSFQFSGGPPAVYLGQGPGDLRGPAPFTVHTDNGTLNGNGATVEEFINAANGTLKVTLVPEREGTATVTVSGPCGLSDLPGNTIVLGVTAEEFVPEPGSVMLLASGLMGLAGYAGLRLRKR